MVAVGKHLGLMRQVRVAAVDQIDAGQAVRLGNLLRAQMRLYRHRIVSAALHRRIVADDHRLPPRNPADAGDHARTGDLAAIKVAGSELAEFRSEEHTPELQSIIRIPSAVYTSKNKTHKK